MKQGFAFFVIILFLISGSALFAQDLSGVLDSTVNYTAGAGGSQSHSFGLEQFANLRLRVRTGERATLISAFNLIAISGNYVEAANSMQALNQNPLASTPFAYGQNYAAAIELERLYFRINSDLFDTEAGLLRMAFGYGQVWGPSDFLNPRNPLSHNARHRGVLGTTFSFYPADSMELMLFAAAPRDPFESDGSGFIIPGVALDQHWSRGSVQVLYAYETPRSFDTTSNFPEAPLAESKWGKHRFGLSIKADLELGFMFDALYTLNPGNADGIEGLSASAGFDYSFLDGDLYVLFEYLFNGSSSATAFGAGGFFLNHHYLYGAVLYKFNIFTSLTFSTVFCFDDLSFQPILRFDYEIFQGFSLNLTANVPFDQKSIRDGKVGELGPKKSHARAIVNAGARLRF
ncbi:MAG: hypothetical protein FWD87_07055 [Spirochaetaceae bacterium]|nr:hypothetical protein [Spirochaetaceae bacterium]